MVKDRLQELINKTYESQNGLNHIELNLTDQNFDLYQILNEYGEVRITLSMIESNIDAMDRMTQKTNIRNFNENELENVQCQNLKHGQQLMLQFSRLKGELPNDDDFSLIARVKRGLFYGLHQTYINLWNKNEAFLNSYETKLKKHLKLHSKILNYNSTEEEVEDLIANKTTSLFVDNILEDTERERQTLRDLMERYSELKKLEKSIEDVHALFLRIQNLVFEQNDLIQVIELHAQQASIRVDKGTDELEEAHVLRKKTLKKKTCLIVIGIVVLLILLVLLFT